MSTIYYDRESVGGGNPYWSCTSCKRTDPQISVGGHLPGCDFVALHGMRPSLNERFARVRAFIGDGYWLPNTVDFVRTVASGQALGAALDDALEVIASATTPEDAEAARELAHETLRAVFA